MKEFFKRKLIYPIIDLLKQGITPEKIALSISFGAALGVFPVLGSTVTLCGIASYIFRLNILAIQVVNYLVYPMQLILFIPFIRLGELVLRHEPFPISMEIIYNMLKEDMWNAIQTLWVANLYGIFAWTITAPLIAILIYYTTLPLLKKVLKEKIAEEKD